MLYQWLELGKPSMYFNIIRMAEELLALLLEDALIEDENQKLEDILTRVDHILKE